MAGYWLVGRTVMWPRLCELRPWLDSLGLDTPNLLCSVTVAQTDDGRYQVHVTERLLRDGQPYLDVNLDEVASRPIVVDVEKDSWPAWLNGMDDRLTPVRRVVHYKDGVEVG